MKHVLIAICMLFCSSVIGANDKPESLLLEQISRRLIVGSGLQGTFQQEKHLAFLQQPFISSGEFTLSRTTGLRWHVTEPLESLMLVQESGVVLDDKPVKDHGIGQLMATIMLGMMEGKLSGITEYFAVNGEITEETWRMTFEPTSPRLQVALEHIDLLGDDYLRTLIIHERGDNRTVIQFTAIRPLVMSGSGSVVAAP